MNQARSFARRAVALALLTVFLPACFGGEQNLTESGEGLPELTAEFPDSVEPGANATATFEVSNPGPGDMDAVSIAFALLGDPELPEPILAAGRNGKNPAIVDISPEPKAISPDAAVFVFDGLPEGESTTIEFTIRVPTSPGRYANSVTASDGSLDRSRGVRLETQVQR